MTGELFLRGVKIFGDTGSTTDCNRFLKSLRTSNPHKLAFAHLNINSIEISWKCYWIKGNIDILMVSETKIDDSRSGL